VIEEPSLLILIQDGAGGHQITSLMIEALGGLILTLYVFMIENSWTLIDDVFKVRFPDKETLEIIKLIAAYQLMVLS